MRYRTNLANFPGHSSGDFRNRAQTYRRLNNSPPVTHSQELEWCQKSRHDGGSGLVRLVGSKDKEVLVPVQLRYIVRCQSEGQDKHLSSLKA